MRKADRRRVRGQHLRLVSQTAVVHPGGAPVGQCINRYFDLREPGPDQRLFARH